MSPQFSLDRDAMCIAAAHAIFATPADPAARFTRWSHEDLHNERLSARERLRHTRASRVAHKLVAQCLDTLADVPHDRIGIVTASVYAGTDETQATRRAHTRPGVGVDPVQFSKATHSYVAAVLASSFGLRGPATSLVGRTSASTEALRHAYALLDDRLADVMLVVAFDELSEAACQHLAATRPARARFAEACAVLALRRVGAGHNSPRPWPARWPARWQAQPCDEDIDHLAGEPLRAFFRTEEAMA